MTTYVYVFGPFIRCWIFGQLNGWFVVTHNHDRVHTDLERSKKSLQPGQLVREASKSSILYLNLRTCYRGLFLWFPAYQRRTYVHIESSSTFLADLTVALVKSPYAVIVMLVVAGNNKPCPGAGFRYWRTWWRACKCIDRGATMNWLYLLMAKMMSRLEMVRYINRPRSLFKRDRWVRK